MKKIKNKKIEKLCNILMSKQSLRVIFAILIVGLLVIVISCIGGSLELNDFIEISTFTAIILAFILDGLVSLLSGHYKKGKEDSTKLTEDYDGLLKQYCRVKTFIEADNENSDEINELAGKKFTSCKPKDSNKPNSYVLPVCDKICLTNKKVVINDDDSKIYTPNSYITEKMPLLNEIYKFSNHYNCSTIRVDDIKEDGNKITLFTSRTKYFYSLITNRAIDYKINGLSYRELFEEGPFLRDLKESTLSNHFGYNGYIETLDNKFIFVFRDKKVSIGKNTLQSSVSASLKAKFALDEEKKLTKEGFSRAIKKEIIDELKLKNVDSFENRINEILGYISFDKNIIYFYRDLVEGGKPQFVFYSKLNITSNELIKIYTKGAKKRIDDDIYSSADGDKIFFVDRKDMHKIYVTPDSISFNGKAYKATPSAVATYLMLMEYLQNENN